jgi:hypothetical protein
VVVEPVSRPLVQGPGRLPTAGVAFDPAVVRVGGVPTDAADLQRPAVHPRAVHVAVEKEDRAVRDDGVEVLLAGRPAPEVLHGPAAAEHPRLVRVGRRIRGDRVEVGLPPDQVVQPDPQPVAAGERRVDVAVLEAGQDQATGG